MLLLTVVTVMPTKAQTEQKTLTVDELFQLIESNSKTLQVQKTSVEFANKGIEAARAERLPDVGAQASVSYNGNVLISDRDFSDMHGYSSPHLGTAFTLEAQQVVYAGGAIDAGIRMAELGKLQAQTGLELTRQQQRFLGLGQFLDLCKLKNRMQVYEENIRTTQKLIDDIRAKQAQGMALKNDVTRYELQMESLRLGLRKLTDQRAILNHQLANQLGLFNVVLVPMESDIFDVSEHPVSSPSEASYSTSPLLEQARLNTLMSEQQLRLAKSDMLPKVSLFAADQLNGPFTYDIPPKDINVNFWYVGVGLRYSISSLFKQNKKVRQAAMANRQSIESQMVTDESLNNQMQQAWTLYQQAFVELDTQRKSVQLAQQNYEVVNERYMAQLALVTDMLDASNMKLNAELSEVDARINIAYAYYRMQYIAGKL